MKGIIGISILRRDSQESGPPHYQDFEIEAQREMTVLQALGEVYGRFDPTLAFRRYRCGRRICRSCEVKVDGKIVRGCATLLYPGENYTIEPARRDSVIRDLVCDFDLHL